MQQQPQMMNMMQQQSFPPTNITTEQIQKYLDENKKLILAILDNQNLGKLAECAQYQAVLQKNLMYLAAIADAQPPAPSLSTQMPTPLGMQQGVPYMQHSQASMAQQPQQSGGFPPKVPMQFNPQHIQQQDQQHHQIHMGMRPGVSNGMSSEVSLGGNGGVPPSSTISMSDFSRGVGVGTSNSMEARGKDQDGMERGSGDGQGNSVAGHNVANGEH